MKQLTRTIVIPFSLMLDYPNGAINQFYNNPRVQEALNLPHETKWVECIPGAGRRRRQLSKMRLPGQLLLDDDRPTSTVPYVADLLDNAGIRVLIYNGDRDMTTNSQGSELLLDTMSWSGASGWADVDKFERGIWLPNNEKKLGGYIKHYLNLGFLVVYNSGHLVPFNQDEISLDLVTRFLGNVSFLDKSLPKFQVHRKRQHDVLANKQESDVGGYHSEKNLVGDVISSVVFVVVGFAIGFLVARRYQKGRGLYQAIPSN
jgi:Serine carboxypeptidase